MRKNWFFISFLVVLAVRPAVQAQTINISATVNPTNVLVANYEGWGSSLCWWANVVGAYANRTNYCSLAFTTLKLNIVRYNIGGGENPNITDELAFQARIPGFEPTNGVWNWSADANQRWILKEAVALGANHVEAFANSPPWWMTVSGSVTGAVGNSGHNDNLQTAYETNFASYLATVVSNLTVLDGVHFEEVTPMNEPEGPWSFATNSGAQEGCHMDSGQQARVVNDLRAALNTEQALTTGIDAPETYAEGDAATAIDAYGSATNNVAVLTSHTYGTKDIAGLHALAVGQNKPLWISEYCDNDGSGLSMARRIHDDVTGTGARAWMTWQVVDNRPGYGFLYNLLNDTGTTNFTFNEKFYVMGQFSEYVRPGCQIINVNDDYSLAAYNPTNQTLVIVAVNDTSTNLAMSYNLSSFAGLPATASVIRTAASGNLNLASQPAVTVANQSFSCTLIPDSVTTFILTNVSQGFSGAYELKNVKSGLALNVTSAATTNGAPIIQWPYNGSANSLWSFVPTSNGYYQIVNQNSGKDVVVLNEATTNGAPIIQWSFGTTGDDQWDPVLNSDGSYTLYNLHSGMVLDNPGASTASGTQMDQWPANGGSNQHWQLISQ